MRTLVCLLSILTVLCAFATSASAQNITVGDVEREDDVYDGEFAFYISKADCEEGELFEFAYATTSLVGVQSLQIWLSEGADCGVADNRNGSDADCVLVESIDSPESDDTIVLSAGVIADKHRTIDGCTDEATSTEPHQTLLYFLLITNSEGDVEAGNKASIATVKVDLIGPKAPTDIEATAADSAVVVTYEEVSQETDHYNAYCFPKAPDDPDEEDPGTDTEWVPYGGVAGGGGTGGTGGSGGAAGGGGAGGGGGPGGGGGAGGGGAAGEGGEGGTGAEPTCETGDMEEGEPPPAAYFCERIDSNIGGTIEPLENGEEYAIGIAGVDGVGNVGDVSMVFCVAPVPVDDFFEEYREANGQGGCIGGCMVSRDPVPAWLLAAGGVLGLALVRRRSRRRSRNIAKIAGPLAFVVTAFAASSAQAADDIPNTNWRQHDRAAPPPADTKFAFEVRFGPYWPQVDDEPGLTGTPYEDVFGTDPRFAFGLEFDYMPFRIPYVGMVGIGVGWGYTWASAHALRTGCDPDTEEDTDTEDDLGPCETGDKTKLEIMPMHASLVVRADELMRRTGVPLVPYGKFGFGWAYWESDTTKGVSTVDTGEEEPLYAQDVTIGLHAVLGLALALNWLDAASAGSLRESTGIGHAYLFAEWTNFLLDGFGGSQMHVGTMTFTTGLAFDF